MSYPYITEGSNLITENYPTEEPIIIGKAVRFSVTIYNDVSKPREFYQEYNKVILYLDKLGMECSPSIILKNW